MSNLTSVEIAFVEQLKTTLDALLEANSKVETHCWDYSSCPEESQREYLEMLEFRKMQVEGRAKMLLTALKGD